MTDILSPLPIIALLDNNSNQAVGAKLFTYAAGTTTKLSTYTSSSGATPNTNPIILDDRGEANVWVPAATAYKFVFAPSTDTDPPTNPFWTVDNIVTGNAQGQIPGTNTNDNAAAGNIGEYIQNTLLIGSAVALTTATAVNITSITLTAGDWDVWATAAFAGAGGATATFIECWTSSSSLTSPTLPNNGGVTASNDTTNGSFTAVMPVNLQRFSLATTTVVFLEAVVNFSGGTAKAYGFIGARRAR